MKPAAATKLEAGFSVDPSKNFEHFGLDERLLQAVRKLKWEKPTVVQACILPLALKGKDILARANPGTGKTAGYLLPVLQNLIKQKQTSRVPHVSALILVPSHDLCRQVSQQLQLLLTHLKKLITCVALLPEDTESFQSLLATKPDIIVSTPHVLFQHMNSAAVDLSKLTSFVIDEADLILQHSRDVGSIRTRIPLTCQVYMMSATLTEDVLELKKRILNSPYVIKLQDDDNDFNVEQYYIKCTKEKDKYLALYGLYRTEEITGKTIIFVNSIDMAFKLHIFLDMFKIKCAVLNSELPENSRNHIVNQFNSDAFHHLIVTDESVSMDELSRRKSELQQKDQPKTSSTSAAMDTDETEAKAIGKKRKRSGEDGEEEDDVAASKVSKPAVKKTRLETRAEKIMEKEFSKSEYGMHRGIDFLNVAWVVNFDPSPDPGTYVHRIGRTGRAGKQGKALTFFVGDGDEEDMFSLLFQENQTRERTMVEYPKAAADFEKLRTRVQDVLSGITKAGIKRARVTELAREILNSEKLKAHFQDSPGELRAPTHLATVRPKRMVHAAAYIADVPKYMGLPVKSSAEIFRHEKSEKVKEQRDSLRKKLLALRKKKEMDPLARFSMEKCRKVEKKLSNLDMKVLDPQGRKRFMTEKKQRRKISKWAQKCPRKELRRHHRRAHQPPPRR